MKNLIGFILILAPFFSLCQDAELLYLKSHSKTIDPNQANFEFPSSFYENDIFFFGFVHGSQTPQLLDYELLKKMYQEGVNHYVPEMDYSLAYFFNTYLENGDTSFLKFACENYKNIVNQDASLQFYQKWKKIYTYNQTLPDNRKLTVQGFDIPLSNALSLTHLAYIAPTEKTGITIIDSLSYFKNLKINSIHIISGKPVLKSGKNWDYFFSDAKDNFYKRFKEEFIKDSIPILNAFGNSANAVSRILNNIRSGNREQNIFANFKKFGLPLIQSGEKFYANYGYFHIQQNTINGNAPLALLLKQKLDLKVTTLLAVMRKSSCYTHTKYKSTGAFYIKDVKFKGAKPNGYQEKKSWDGDTFFEKIKGMSLLKKVAKQNSVTLFELDADYSPFKKGNYFASMSRGGKNWKTAKNKSTTDYFQYLFLIQNSTGNLPFNLE